MKTTMIALIVILTRVGIDAEIIPLLDKPLSLPDSLTSVIDYLEDFVKLQENRNHLIEKVIDKFKTVAEQVNKEPKKFMANPVNSFIITKLLSIDLATFFNDFKSDQVLESTDTIQKYNFTTLKLMNLSQAVEIEIRKKIKLPDEKDYLGSIKSLIRLQETFDLSSSQIIEGTFGDSVSIRPLNAFECFEIGRIAQIIDDHHVAVDWFNQSKRLMGLEGDASKVNQIDLLNQLTYSLYQLGDYFKAVELSRQLINLSPNKEKFKVKLNVFQNLLVDKLIKKYKQTDDFTSTDMSDIFDFKSKKIKRKDSDQEAFERLCRADNPNVKMSKNSNLKCRYARYHPLLVIAPVKEEQVHDDPPIRVYYEVISKRHAQEMIRLRDNIWLSENKADFLPRLSKLLAALTNLSMETAGDWQMNQIGLGGEYELHCDFSRADNEDINDRMFGLKIATWLYYLEEPDQGGATVFPYFGVHIKPVERSAAFWFNLLPNGERDYRTLHSGCPVLVGSKWTSNRWIRSFGQEFLYPCV